MKLSSPSIEVHYPESDGKPMGETDLHRDWIVYLIDLFRYRYRQQQVYVSGDLLLYYVKGDPRKFVVPDAFVVKDCDPCRRRVFKIWEEGRIPNAIFEITSASSRKEDTRTKPKTYARIQVPEYFAYDPTCDYLTPPLQGFRLGGKRYTRMEPDASGALVCEQLDVLLRLEDGKLALFDRPTGARLLTATQAAEAEVERLRKLLGDAGAES